MRSSSNYAQSMVLSLDLCKMSPVGRTIATVCVDIVEKVDPES